MSRITATSSFKTVAASLRTSPLVAEEARRVGLALLDCPEIVAKGSGFDVGVRIMNHSSVTLRSYFPFPVRIAYHWVDANTGTVVIFDGERTSILPSLPSGSARDCRATVKTPPKPGTFRLQIRLVQESVRWFEECDADDARERIIQVT